MQTANWYLPRVIHRSMDQRQAVIHTSRHWYGSFIRTPSAAGIVGETDTAKVTQWKKNQSDLKGPIEVGNSGQIKEWYTETTVNSLGQGYNHRHLSHMLGLFPSDLISVDTPEWLAAARVSMENRVDK